MNKFKFSFPFILVLLFSQINIARSQSILPKPDHIVIVILENHSYSQIIGSLAAPYINSLATDTLSALFTASYGIGHPSQPNYLALYSGSTQGVINDGIPFGNPFTTPNLGSQLISSGLTFVTYSEDLPSEGFNGGNSGNYARRHNPAANWMGTGINQVSSTTNQPFTAFPTDFTLLPTVCFVVPNVKNDMHDGTDPLRITTGDNWISTQLDRYVQWSKANNSLFILTFDEGTATNQIATILTGQMVQPGIYSTKINHHSILHTIEKLYGLPVIGDSISTGHITSCWNKDVVSSLNFSKSNLICSVYPNPASGSVHVNVINFHDATARIFNLNGELMLAQPLMSENTVIDIQDIKSGLYLIKISTKEGVMVRKFVKEERTPGP